MQNDRRFQYVIARFVALPLIAVLAWVGSTIAAEQAVLLTPREAVDLLRGGGHVLYFRHAATDMSKNDANMTSYEDCATQRNLTDGGRTDARQIGAAIRSLKIPIGQVRASPFCRTVETAQLAFGRVEKSASARGGPSQPENADRYAELRKLLAQQPDRGTNDVILSHGNPFFAVAGPPYLAEGEAAIVRPEGDGFRVVARIKPTDWPRE
jgi:phosphohistidine phosphatase SixA